MSGKKNKSGLIITVIVALAAMGGGVAYVSKSKNAKEMPSEQAQVNTDSAPQEAAPSNPADVATAAGDAQEQAAPPINADGIKVEPGNPVVARVDGKDISRVDVYRFIQTMPANVQQLPATTVYPMAMEQVINTRIVQNQAEETDIVGSEQFKNEMEIAKQQIMRNLYLQKQVDSKIDEKMIKKAYDDYMKKVPDVEERRARHILVETEDKAKAVVEKLKTEGAEFGEIAKSLSIGPTGPKGGDLGYFAKADMVPEFANAAFGMEKNSILETPVKTQFGWHVIQLVDIRERPKPTLQQMAPALQAELRREALDDLLKKWRKKAKVEQFDINGQPLKEGANVIGIIPPEESKENQGG